MQHVYNLLQLSVSMVLYVVHKLVALPGVNARGSWPFMSLNPMLNAEEELKENVGVRSHSLGARNILGVRSLNTESAAHAAAGTAANRPTCQNLHPCISSPSAQFFHSLGAQQPCLSWSLTCVASGICMFTIVCSHRADCFVDRLTRHGCCTHYTGVTACDCSSHLHKSPHVSMITIATAV